jgi:hypothetical protein
MLRILVAGDVDDADPKNAEVRSFCAQLGQAIIDRGHVCVNGCKSELDKLVAEAADARLRELDAADADKRLISYVLTDQTPVHELGTVIRSRLSDWDLDKEMLYVPEQIRLADVAVFVGGGLEGTYCCANWMRIASKPLLPFAGFGGAAARLYDQEFSDFARKYGNRVDEMDYQALASVSSDWAAQAQRIVALAEKLSASRQVTAIMSYSQRPELEDAYDSFCSVCAESGYDCQRIEELNTIGRIVPEILERIEHSAFVIADLTELKSNVFFELGYAEGMKKPIVVTAMTGTQLPFDVKDVPTIFWDGQRKLKDDLRAKIGLMSAQG